MNSGKQKSLLEVAQDVRKEHAELSQKKAGGKEDVTEAADQDISEEVEIQEDLIP